MKLFFFLIHVLSELMIFSLITIADILGNKYTLRCSLLCMMGTNENDNLSQNWYGYKVWEFLFYSYNDFMGTNLNFGSSFRRLEGISWFFVAPYPIWWGIKSILIFRYIVTIENRLIFLLPPIFWGIISFCFILPWWDDK